MQSLWNDEEAAHHMGALEERAYSSRLLGQDPALVLHGGGNTSVKLRERNVVGEEEDILYVKGSGWDLATIEPAGFSPVRLDRLLALSRLERLSDSVMARELASNMTDAAAPSPSVEAILHAILPHRFVDHTHADAFIAVSNTANGVDRIREIYGDLLVIVPYVMPGFKLARVCAEIFPREAGPQTIGMALMNHGLFSFGATARESYERMISLVTRAEDYLQKRGAWDLPTPAIEVPSPPNRVQIASLRSALSEAAGNPMVVVMHTDPQTVGFATRDDVATISQRGPATPDHVLRTKQLPMIGSALDEYREEYERYFKTHAPQADAPLTQLDPAPRVILSPSWGMATVGRTAKDAAIVEDIYRHTIDIILRASLLGGYEALQAADIFEAEYWDLEQAKLRRAGTPPLLAGEVALVTGAASGIGKATVHALVLAGAAVVALDRVDCVGDLYQRVDVLPLQCDITDEAAVGYALDAGVRAFGGLDMLVLNAGAFPSSRAIAALPSDEWDRTMRVNVDANLVLLREAHPLLRVAPRGGRVVVVGSKNVPAPGPGAAAYSASKAALTQLARVAALEWGADSIRVNVIHPNAVFDTGLWSEDILRSRAESYGMTVDEYKTNNVLRTEVTSRDVANLTTALLGPLFARTTGAQIPIDGGNERVI